MAGPDDSGHDFIDAANPHKGFFGDHPQYLLYDTDGEARGTRIPRRMKGRWDEGTVEHELIIIDKTKKLLAETQNEADETEIAAVKKNLKRELEALGWIYNRGATFKANFPFRRKYLVFDSTVMKEDRMHVHRIRIVTGSGGVSDYKLMRWAVV